MESYDSRWDAGGGAAAEVTRLRAALRRIADWPHAPPGRRNCPTCDGDGRYGPALGPCSTCYGRGYQYVADDGFVVRLEENAAAVRAFAEDALAPPVKEVSDAHPG